MNSVLNISAYRFVALGDTQALRTRLFQEAGALGLLGTILLAPEGINLFLAGAPDAIRAFLDRLRADARRENQRWSRRPSILQPPGPQATMPSKPPMIARFLKKFSFCIITWAAGTSQ